MSVATEFPVPLNEYKVVALDPAQPTLTDDQREQLAANIQLCRDAITFFTTVAEAKGLGGYTGGPYDTVPETLIVHGFMENARQGGMPDVLSVFFDDSRYRAATQYLMPVLEGELPSVKLFRYPASGEQWHMWPYVNNVAMANPDKVVFVHGWSGSQMEGNDAEAARLFVAQDLNVKLLIGDNDLPISGRQTDDLPRINVKERGLKIDVSDREDIDGLYAHMCTAATTNGPRILHCYDGQIESSSLETRPTIRRTRRLLGSKVSVTRDQSLKPKRLFVSYAHDDDVIPSLSQHLKILSDRGYIEVWQDTFLVAGEDWKDRILEEVRQADIILMLYSTASRASEFIQTIEGPLAVSRANAKDSHCTLIAVPLDRKDWDVSVSLERELKKFQAATWEGKPVLDYSPQRKGWQQVERSIQQAVQSLWETEQSA